LLSSLTDGYNTAHTKGISQKLLAVMGGLGRYGRNNICYINGFGSHCSLSAFYTDIPYSGMTGEAFNFMEQCKNCGICKKKCPTGAIYGSVTDVPVINADLCLNKYTYRLDPIPEEIPIKAFNALIGCWLCQESCPANKNLPMESAAGLDLGLGFCLELNEAETAAFLAYNTPMPPELIEKLKNFFKNDHLLSVAGRNAALVLGLYNTKL
jgi:epoxyqueuosine reductase